jgi:hypothetical protein
VHQDLDFGGRHNLLLQTILGQIANGLDEPKEGSLELNNEVGWISKH